MHKRTLPPVALAAAAMLIAFHADAQVRRIAPAAQPARQAAAPGVATFGTPSPSGLPSPVPAGLTPPGPPSLTPPGTVNLASPGTPAGSPPIDAGIATGYTAGGGGGGAVASSGGAYGSATNVMGAGPAMRGGPLSAVDIARAFMDADTNRDGELSRGEAQRLSILTTPFDDLDRNRDGVLSRFEYDDAFR
jgi:hypothetical protein